MANNIETYSEKSIAQQLLGDTKLGKWLWGNNTYKDGGTIQKYQNPSGAITGQLSENKSWDEKVDSWYEHMGVSKPLGSVNNKHQYDVTEYSGTNADTVKMDNNVARQILNYPPTYLSKSPESDISVIQNKLNTGAIIDSKFVKHPSAEDALKLIEDDYSNFQSQLENKERYKYISPVDDSELVKITAPNTNKAKYIFGHKISKNLINDIRVAAIERDQDPYDVLAHVLIEGGGRYDNTIQSHDYFNTHDLIQKQFPNKYLWQNFDKESILKNLGIYQDDQNYKYTFDQIIKAGRKQNSERSKVLNNVIVPKSTADAVALHMQLHGRDFNPKQKGLTLGDGTYMPKVTVRHNYLDMIDDGIKSLKENMPNLFKKQGGKLKLQPGGKITPEHARLLGRRGMPGDKEALAAAGYDSKGRPLVTFGGGSFGAAGAGATFGEGVEQIDNHDYVRNTPILQSFSEAFNNARKSGLKSFTFNGKKYTTEMSDNPNYVGKRYQPLLNIREVLDKNMKVMSDSTRIEPYVGQLPGIIKRKSSQ